MKQPTGLTAVGFRCAIGFVFAIQAAKDVVLGRPLHIVADKEIQQSVAVVVEPDGGGAERLSATQSARLRNIDESTFSRVLEKPVLTYAGNKDVGIAVVIVISDGDAHAVHGNVESGAAGHV